MPLDLTDALRTLVKAQYSAAKASGALTYSSSHLAVINVGGVPFQLRFCPGLAKKPKGQNDKVSEPSGAKPDPFENPPRDLFVADIPKQNPSHIVVLNKYPIIQNHFILATKRKKEQTYPLEEDDLTRAYQCVKEWERGPGTYKQPRKLFAFFNSGAHSGASQPHRHLQFLPVEDMEGDPDGQGWQLLVDSIMAGTTTTTTESGIALKKYPKLPFVLFGVPLPQDPSPAQLHQVYSTLYKASLTEVQSFAQAHPQELKLHSTDEGGVPFSYNLAMTLGAMVMCPRRSEGQMVARPDGSDVDFVALNGTVLGGTLMVKNEELFELLKSDTSKLGAILEAIGIPRSKLPSSQI